MKNKKDEQVVSEVEPTESNTMQVNIRMQHGEHSGQPLYSNFTSIQGGQGVVIVDFGFLDPQTINSLSRSTRSADKVPETVDARILSRMAISVDAAKNLAQQLNHAFQTKS